MALGIAAEMERDACSAQDCKACCHECCQDFRDGCCPTSDSRSYQEIGQDDPYETTELVTQGKNTSR